MSRINLSSAGVGPESGSSEDEYLKDWQAIDDFQYNESSYQSISIHNSIHRLTNQSQSITQSIINYHVSPARRFTIALTYEANRTEPVDSR